MKRLATVATIALVAIIAPVGIAVAKTATFDAETAGSTPPSHRYTLGQVVLSGASANAQPHTIVQVADARTRQRRTRIATPRRTAATRRVAKPRFKTTDSDDRANAPAPLDCSIQSHPDCQPKPGNRPVLIQTFDEAGGDH